MLFIGGLQSYFTMYTVWDILLVLTNITYVQKEIGEMFQSKPKNSDRNW